MIHISNINQGFYRNQATFKCLYITTGNQIYQSRIYIVTCTGVLVTLITGSSLDDWIYLHLGYKFS
jgi:hypothetical protein